MISNIRKIKAFLKTPRGIFNSQARRAAYIKLPEIEKKADHVSLTIQEEQAWSCAFRNFILAEPEGIKIVEEFYCNPPKLIKKVNFENDKLFLTRA